MCIHEWSRWMTLGTERFMTTMRNSQNGKDSNSSTTLRQSGMVWGKCMGMIGWLSYIRYVIASNVKKHSLVICRLEDEHLAQNLWTEKTEKLKNCLGIRFVWQLLILNISFSNSTHVNLSIIWFCWFIYSQRQQFCVAVFLPPIRHVNEYPTMHYIGNPGHAR